MLHVGLWGLNRLDCLPRRQFREEDTQSAAPGVGGGIYHLSAIIPSMRCPLLGKKPSSQLLASVVEAHPAKLHRIIPKYTRDTRRQGTGD